MNHGPGGRAERNLKLVIEYDGTGLAGWQRQADRPTVQGLLETALARLTGETITVFGAGRTDAGVHARGQAASLRTASRLSLEEIRRGLNALVPDQIAVLSVEEVPLDFHARYSARTKVYDYDLMVSAVRPALERRFLWHQRPGLDVEAMARALPVIVGRHDFAGFQSSGSSVQTTVREVIAARLETRPDGLVRISIEADGFLRHMVRAIVGTLVEVGRGRMTPEAFADLLSIRDRSRAGPTAPARGLFLRKVRY